jgi:long-chain acyl-CoA synthetase
MARLGVKKGDRVAIMLPNCPQTIIAYYATLSLGAVVVMTNPLYTERELERQWSESGVTAAVVLDRMWPKVERVRSKVGLRDVIVTGIEDYLAFPKNLLFLLKARRERTWVDVTTGGGVIRLRPLMAGAPATVARPVVLSPGDLACLQYTGGTTGIPKGAMLTHGNLVATATQIRLFLMPGAKDAEDRIVAILPMFHAYGMNAVMNLGIHLAATLILLPLLDLKMLMDSLQASRPTFFLGVPTLYAAVVNYPGVDKMDLSSIKACFSGGAPMSAELMRRFEALTGGRIAEAYGLTEASSVTHVNPRYGTRKIGSVGLPIVGTDARIVDAESGTRDLPAGEVGEIAVRGPQVMQGYWGQPEESAAALHPADGGPWLFTGDLGRMDENGYFFIVDRKKELVITGGFNVYPREVEEVLSEHPAVHEAAVVGIPDVLRGERVKAYVVLKPGAAATAAQIVAFCRERLASYKAPRAVEFRLELPHTASGKVSRRLLREAELAAGTSLSQGEELA